MASPNVEVCIVCGVIAVKGSRRVISSTKCESIAILWKEIVSEEQLDKRGKPIADLDVLLSGNTFFFVQEMFLFLQ